MTHFLDTLRTALKRLSPALFSLFVFLLPMAAYAQEGEGAVKATADVAAGLALSPIAGLALLILTLANAMFYLVGALFNWVVVELVFQFANTIGNAPGILISWGILRDIGNILLLFGFVFMGVATILNLHDYPVKKTIPKLIIFAVLLNFSLFAAEAVIDASNVFASALYNNQVQACADGSTTRECTLVFGITGSFVQAAGIGTIFAGGAGEAWLDYFKDPYHQIILLISLAIFVTISMVVLLAASILLISRAVTLGFLMVTAPIGFVGLAIPPLEKLAQKWWHTLFSNAFFAPVFFLLIFVALKIVEGLRQSLDGGEGLAAALSADNVTAMGAIVIFAVVIGFMVAALIIAKQFGIQGADFAINSASAVVYGTLSRGTNLAVGGLGRGGRALLENSPVRNLGVTRFIVQRGLLPLETTNTDMRKMPGVGLALGAAGIKEGAKPSADYASYRDITHIPAKLQEESEAHTAEYNARQETADLERNAHGGPPGGGGTNLTPENLRHLANMGVKELEQLHGIREGLAELARNLSPEQFEALMKSDKLNDGQKNALRDARLGRMVDLLDVIANPASTADQRRDARLAIRRWSPKDLSQIALSNNPAIRALLDNPARANQFAAALSDSQADAVKGSDKLVAGQKQAFEQARENRFVVAAIPAPTLPARQAQVRENLAGMTPEELAKLPGRVIRSADVLENIRGRQLASLDPGKLSDDVVQAILTRLNDPAAAVAGPGGAPSQRAEFDTMITDNPDSERRWAGRVP